MLFTALQSAGRWQAGTESARQHFRREKKSFSFKRLWNFFQSGSSFFVHMRRPARYKNIFLLIHRRKCSVQAPQARSSLQSGRQFDDARLQGPKVRRPKGRQQEEVMELCEGMIDVSAALFNVSS